MILKKSTNVCNLRGPALLKMVTRVNYLRLSVKVHIGKIFVSTHTHTQKKHTSNLQLVGNFSVSPHIILEHKET